MTESNQKPTIVIAGAGSIGCFVGGVLARNGADVRFLGRDRIASMLRANGLKLTDHQGLDALIPAQNVKIGTEPTVLADAEIVLVTVKSGATGEMARLIADYAPREVIIVSLQNGAQNAEVLRAALPNRDVRAGMVAYNVLNAGDGRFHRGTAGGIVLEAGTPDVAAILAGPDLPVHASSDIRAVQWGKLLVNLNNALNALSGEPLRDELLNQKWRALLADQISEGLAALSAEGINPRSAFKVPLKIAPHLMRLPTPLYKVLAGRSFNVDPEARSSMWEDLESGRKTEVDALQGAIVALCEKHGLTAPVNARVMALIREAEKAGKGSPALDPANVRAGL
ncbi:MAG: 2-dehydropantoate 2-reductase [Pseudomonadota bacterium]